jgi:hypothetical protein
MPTIQGHCLCGAIIFEADGAPLWSCFCHCESCRRNTSAPVTAFLGFRRTDVRFTGKPLRRFHSSPGVTRSFCADCGTPLAFEGERWPDEIHLYAASLAEPETFRPQGHVHWCEKLPWLLIDDDLPKFPHNSS